MCKKIKYTALSRAKCVEQVCFGKVDFKASCPNTFATNIDKKIKTHKEFDTLKKEQFSIDRVDSRQGHIKDNIQLMCWGCNRAKKNRF